MRLADFITFVKALADEDGYERIGIIFCSDQLGPQLLNANPPSVPMQKARELVAGYVVAGFRGIHLDCAERYAGTPAHIDDTAVAVRTTELSHI